MKNLLFKQLFRVRLFACIIIASASLFSAKFRAQSSCPSAPIFFNGTTIFNGIQIIGASSGDIGSTSPGLQMGLNRGAWSTTLTFNKPVNNLVFCMATSNNAVNAHFNTNGGNVSITSTFSTNNIFTISGNTIVAPSNTGGGLSGFKITSPTAFTTITINGDAFPSNVQGHYSLITLYSASVVLKVDDVNNTVESNDVTIYPNPVKNMMTISSKKEHLKSYKIFDESGKLILSSSLKGNKQNVNLSSIKSGHYVVSVETEKQTINTKLIKE
ncbi:T9SS type A sorting domain-containing protein [Chryseobacterium nematophagum]|nr:T9SS type A sorting domain-containing protein [Chryseobacterium nematophagum]